MDPAIIASIISVSGALLTLIIDKLTGRGLTNIYTEEAARQAVSNYTEHIKKLGYDPITESVLIAEYPLLVKKQRNKNTIVKIALEELNEQQHLLSEEKIKNIDEDWLNLFFDAAEKISKEDVQRVWGRILSEKFTRPGSVPKSLIHILSIIDDKPAAAFTEISKHRIYIFGNGDYDIYPICDYDCDNTYWNGSNIKYDTLIELEALGLIRYEPSIIQNEPTMGLTMHYGEEAYIDKNKKLLIVEDSISEHLETGNISFTDAGKALSKAINALPNDIQASHVRDFLLKRGIKIEEKST